MNTPRIDRPLVWLHGEIKSPPFSGAARREVGYLLRQVQDGVSIGMPESRAMPSVGKRCRELRINDANKAWRLIYRPDADVVLVVEVFEKRSATTPQHVVAMCRERLKRYDALPRKTGTE